MNLFAVHVLHLDDIEGTAQAFVRVGQEFKGELLFTLEVFMRFQAVARDAEDFGAQRLKFRVEFAEVLSFLCAAGRAVLGVEIEDDMAAAQFGGMDDLS